MWPHIIGIGIVLTWRGGGGGGGAEQLNVEKDSFYVTDSQAAARSLRRGLIIWCNGPLQEVYV